MILIDHCSGALLSIALWSMVWYVPQHSSFHDIVSVSQLLFQVEKLTFAEAEQLLIEGVHDVLESRRTDHCLGPI